MNLRPWLGAACLLVGLIVPCTAAAQGKGGATKSGTTQKGGAQKGGKGGKDATPKEETPKDKAAPYMKEGAKAASSGDWDDAYAEYAIAWSILHDWEIAGGIGKAAYKTKHYAESIQRLTLYLKEAPSGKISAKERTEVEGWIADARKNTGQIVITGSTDADLLIDGEDAGKTPVADPIIVDPGKHKVELRKGAQGETKTAEITAGATVTLDFTPPKPPPPKTVIVKEEGVFTPQVRTAAVIGGGALAVGGLVAGGVALGISVAKGNERQSAAKDPFGGSAATSAARVEADAKNTALWCFVGGGVAAIGTGAFYFFTRPKIKAPVKAGAFVGPTGSAVFVEGQF